ncbi:MAG: GAF domain-containing protein [Chloroflexi bacterium]|nr:GAF domain-containing protein [Chloroflexota bacterium]
MEPNDRDGRPTEPLDPTVGSILRDAVEEATRLLGADGGFIYLVDPSDGGLRFAEDAGVTREAAGRAWIRDLHLEPGQGLLGAAIAGRRVVATDDYERDPAFRHTTGADRVVAELGIRAMIAAPMAVEGHDLGALAVYRARPSRFDEAHSALLRALAGHAASSIHNRRLIAELAREREEAARRTEVERTLRQLAARIAVLPDPAETLAEIVEATRRLLGAAVASVDLVEPIDGRWSWVAPAEAASATHDPTNFENRDGPDPMPGIWGLAVREGRAVATGDYLTDPSFVHHPIPDGLVRRDGFRTVAAAPLLSEGRLLGVLGVMSPHPDAAGPAELELLEALATLAATALGTTRRLGELRSSRAELALRVDREHALREIAARVSVIAGPEEILQRIVDECVRLLDADGARIDLYDEEHELLVWGYAAGSVAEADRAHFGTGGLRLGEGIAGRAVLEGRPVFTGDFLGETRLSKRHAAVRYAKETGVRSVLSTPLVSDAGPLGALSVVSRRRDAFGAEDGEVLAALATQAAIAIANSRLVEQLARSREELAHRAEAERAIRQLASQILAAGDVGTVLKSTVDAAVRVLGADGALIDLVDEGSGTLGWAVDSGMDGFSDASWLRTQKIAVGEGLSGRAVARRRVVVTDDYAADPSFAHTPSADAFIANAGIRAMLAAPIVGEGRPLGALEVYARRPAAFDGDAMDLAAALADQAGIAVTNARLIEDLEASRAALRRSVETERSVREIAARIAALADPAHVLARVVDEARRLLGSDGAHLTRMNEARTAVVPVVVAGDMTERTSAWLRTQEFPIGEGINGLAAGQDTLVWTHDYDGDPRIPHDPDDNAVARRLGLRGMAAAPLRAPGGEVIGTLAVSYRRPHDFSEADLERLQGLADHAAIALSNSLLYERLRASEALYRLLVEHSPDVVYQADADGIFTYVSESLERLLGWSPSEIVGRHFSFLVDEGSRQTGGSRWAELAANPGSTLSADLDLIAKDGTRHPYEVTASSIGRDGVFVGMHGSARDISERARLQRELRESEASYRHLVQASPDAIWRAAADGRFTFWSATAEAVFGRPLEELVGSHWSSIVAEESLPVATEAWVQLASDTGRVLRLEFRLLRADGSSFRTETSAVPIFEGGVFAGAHGAVRDLSEHDRLERELVRQAGELAAAEERTHLARELHDSVTQALFSMGLVIRSIEVLMGEDPPRARERLRTLADLQRDALAEIRSLIFELRPGSLAEDGLVRALRTHVAAVEGRIGLPVVLDADDDLGRFPLPVEDALYRIAQEALHNTVKHASARSVRIELRRTRAGARLVVEDDGVGFDPDAVADGHLGLTGMRARAERVGGTLSVEPRRRGTRVVVAVPLSDG